MIESIFWSTLGDPGGAYCLALGNFFEHIELDSVHTWNDDSRSFITEPVVGCEVFAVADLDVSFDYVYLAAFDCPRTIRSQTQQKVDLVVLHWRGG